MALNVGKEIAALKRMTVAGLRQKYAEVFGDSTTSRHKGFLVRRPSSRLRLRAGPLACDRHLV